MTLIRTGVTGQQRMKATMPPKKVLTGCEKTLIKLKVKDWMGQIMVSISITLNNLH